MSSPRRPDVRVLASLIALFLAPIASTAAYAAPAEGVPDADVAIVVLQRSDTIVKRVTGPRHPAGATLVHELTIGSVDGPEEYTFTSLGDALLARDGTIIIIDRGASPGGTPFVRQYDANGKYLRTFGRSGQGPGEYRSPSGIVQLADGRVLVRDGGQRRINVYSPSGEVLDTWRLDPGLTIINAGGHLLLDTAGIIYRRDFIRNQTPAENSPPFGLVRMRADGTVIDTLLPPDLPTLPFSSLSATANRSSRSARVPYAPTTTWAWSPFGYAVTGRTDRYAIDLRIPPRRTSSAPGTAPAVWKEGDPVISIRRDVPQIPITDAERSARRAGMEAFMRATDPRWSWSGPDIPRTKPYFRAIRVAQDGRIWVTTAVPSERYTPEPRPNPTGRVDGMVPFREPTVYDVFEPDGTFLGQLRLPERMNLVITKGDIAWGVVRDEDDVQTLQRFRIVWK